MKPIVFLSLLAISLYTQADTELSKENYGEKWPFTVSSGVVDCHANQITFTANGKTYGINGIAVGTNKYLNIGSIWKDDPEFYELAKAIKKDDESLDDVVKDLGGPTKIDIGPIIDAGLTLCD